MDLQLQDKLALVTGSTAGIGRAIAATLAREGARVILNWRSRASVDQVVATLRTETGADVRGFAGDLSIAASAEQLVREHPGIQILVNNLGIFEPKPFEAIPDADWLRFFDVNVLSGVRLARLVLPAMRRANWGRIIFISSKSGVQIPSEMVHYGVTKTAQLAVSRAWRKRWPARRSPSTAFCRGRPGRAAWVSSSTRSPRRAACRSPSSRRSSSRRRVPPRSSSDSRNLKRSHPWWPTLPARSPRRPPARRCVWMAL